ncbi:hypothetical protein ABB37_08295 [Leptomonas pyrrhocoris]|uniref:Uncharacterized protein n=1 Tax=Leptomonas pyrrhocoris TaxID=157538 RepID=A0A0M9FTH8_LEPPY|nr:hypothetical protein ABB37_08295 [Leptomonas pyrrhocoris]KPA75760.1 hypothetical protein ABB37_08295 [Leptomonas pyrrhocoris]|eukprot:XP_015654199.1 hypothetical protein ABB37_08295 [Leptomonas pyrrhocoris]
MEAEVAAVAEGDGTAGRTISYEAGITAALPSTQSPSTSPAIHPTQQPPPPQQRCLPRTSIVTHSGLNFQESVNEIGAHVSTGVPHRRPSNDVEALVNASATSAVTVPAAGPYAVAYRTPTMATANTTMTTTTNKNDDDDDGPSPPQLQATSNAASTPLTTAQARLRTRSVDLSTALTLSQFQHYHEQQQRRQRRQRAATAAEPPQTLLLLRGDAVDDGGGGGGPPPPRMFSTQASGHGTPTFAPELAASRGTASGGTGIVASLEDAAAAAAAADDDSGEPAPRSTRASVFIFPDIGEGRTAGQTEGAAEVTNVACTEAPILTSTRSTAVSARQTLPVPVEQEGRIGKATLQQPSIVPEKHTPSSLVADLAASAQAIESGAENQP